MRNPWLVVALLLGASACGSSTAAPDNKDPDAGIAAAPDAAPDAGDPAVTKRTAHVIVHYPLGSHGVTIRGSGGSLSWTAGAAAATTAADTVTYEITKMSGAVEWKPLLDDSTWARGPNYRVTPGATVEVWPHFTTTAGRVVTLADSFSSSHVALARPIYAYLPASYDENTDAHFPVIYMHDGQNLWAALPQLAPFGTWNVDTAFDKATEYGACSTSTGTGWSGQPLGAAPTLCTGDGDCASGECRTFPEAIVIGIGNTSNRILELTPTTDPTTPGGGGADGYLAMVIDDLKPTVDKQLRTKPELASTLIAGSSLGGLVSAYAGLTHADVFSAVGEFSPSSWWDNEVIVGDVLAAPKTPRPTTIYIDSGKGEDADDENETDDLAAAYLKIGYVNGTNFRHVIQDGAQHNESFWAQRFPGGVQLLLGVR